MPPSTTPEIFYRFGIALAVGFLIGLEREYSHDIKDVKERLSAGVRTFSLLGLLGCTAAFLADLYDSAAVYAAIFTSAAILIIVSYYITSTKRHTGMTTEVAAIVSILLGSLSYYGNILVVVAAAVAVAVVLSLKLETRSLIAHMRREDLLATLKFFVITAIILPLLPNQNYGPPPVDVINPYSIWLMVILISGISFFGYILIKILGPTAGIGLTGLLGGLISSMAVTLGFTQRSRETEEFSKSYALGIMISWTTMYLRIAVILAAINLGLLTALLLPLSILVLAGGAYCGFLYLTSSRNAGGHLGFDNPFSLRPALQFGLIFAIILAVAKASQFYLGDAGVYLSSIAAGLVDLSAITLSLANLTLTGASEGLSVASRGILLAAMANTLVKSGIVLVTGALTLRRSILPGLFIFLAAGLVAIFCLA